MIQWFLMGFLPSEDPGPGAKGVYHGGRDRDRMCGGLAKKGEAWRKGATDVDVGFVDDLVT